MRSQNFHLAAEPAKASAIIHSQPLHAGRIDLKLFGNFIELLDDVAPGMWAEMLNDRSFEGVTKLANWCYYNGQPDFCDRQWDINSTWSYDTQHPFNGARSARPVTVARDQPAILTQSGLTVKKGMSYAWSGYLRAGFAEFRILGPNKKTLPAQRRMDRSSHPPNSPPLPTTGKNIPSN